MSIRRTLACRVVTRSPTWYEPGSHFGRSVIRIPGCWTFSAKVLESLLIRGGRTGWRQGLVSRLDAGRLRVVHLYPAHDAKLAAADQGPQWLG